MNILFFLKPKSEVAYINSTDSVKRALEKMEYYKFSAIPIIDQNGRYKGTITEGDFLWATKNKHNLDLKALENMPIMGVQRRLYNEPVSINAKVEDLLSKAMKQNFIPVLDDNEIFIGIVTRKDIIQFCIDRLKELA